jgi:hypothetical protein
LASKGAKRGQVIFKVKFLNRVLVKSGESAEQADKGNLQKKLPVELSYIFFKQI